jgi:hypothetical protein
MRDPTIPGDRRVVRQTNEKLASAHRHRPTQRGELIDGASSLADAVVANALREDYHRLTELIQQSGHPGRRDKLSPAEIEEESTLRARIADRARQIGCPKEYGPKQERNDENRLHALHCKRISPPSCGGGTLSAAECAEEAQLLERTLAFRESPEGLARRRILELTLATFSRGPTPAEEDELDRLRKRYPDVPLDDDDPLKKAVEACGQALERQTPARVKRP